MQAQQQQQLPGSDASMPTLAPYPPIAATLLSDCMSHVWRHQHIYLHDKYMIERLLPLHGLFDMLVPDPHAMYARTSAS